MRALSCSYVVARRARARAGPCRAAPPYASPAARAHFFALKISGRAGAQSARLPAGRARGAHNIPVSLPVRPTTACSTTPVANPVDAAALAPRTHTPIMMPRPADAGALNGDAAAARGLVKLTGVPRADVLVARDAPADAVGDAGRRGCARACPRGSTGLIRRRRRAARGSPRHDACHRTCLSCRRARSGAHRAAATRPRQRLTRKPYSAAAALPVALQADTRERAAAAEAFHATATPFT